MKSSKVRFYQNSTLVFCIIFAWVRFTVLFLTDVRWGTDFLTFKKSLAEVSLKKWSSAWKLACKFKSKLWKVNYFYIMYLFGPKWAPKYVLDQKCVHLGIWLSKYMIDCQLVKLRFVAIYLRLIFSPGPRNIPVVILEQNINFYLKSFIWPWLGVITAKTKDHRLKKYISRSLLRCQKRIVIYYVKKFVKESQ